MDRNWVEVLWMLLFLSAPWQTKMIDIAAGSSCAAQEKKLANIFFAGILALYFSAAIVVSPAGFAWLRVESKNMLRSIRWNVDSIWVRDPCCHSPFTWSAYEYYCMVIWEIWLNCVTVPHIFLEGETELYHPSKRRNVFSQAYGSCTTVAYCNLLWPSLVWWHLV